MKYNFVILPLLALNLSSAQDIARDTIKLNEVLVGNQAGKNVKTKTIRYRQDPWCLTEFDDNLEMVTLVDKLPPGRIHSLVFYANAILQNGYTSEDGIFEVMLYAVNPDGTPGEKLYNRPITTILSITDKGEYPIDLYSLDIHSTGAFFTGLKRIDTTTTSSHGVNICGICSTDGFTSYCRTANNPDWKKSAHGFGSYKIDISVAPEKTKSRKR